MKKYTRLLLLIFLTISELSLGQPIGEQSLLWKISGNDITQPSYLYGTIHIICEEDIVIHEVETDAFAKADKVFLELDLDDPALTEEIRVATKSGSHLKNHISSKGYYEINHFFTKQLGYSMETVGMVKPYYLLSYTYKPVIGCDHPVSIEQLLVNEAEVQKKEIYGLETLKQQTAVFDDLNARKQARLLLRQIRRSNELNENYAEILSLYKRGAIQSLNKKIINSPSRRLNRKLLTNRNREWLKKIHSELPQQSNFIAVGAAHLGGRKGLISQLRKKGYTIEAVK